MRAYTQSGQYHTIVESRVHLTWYQSHALNLVVPIDWQILTCSSNTGDPIKVGMNYPLETTMISFTAIRTVNQFPISRILRLFFLFPNKLSSSVWRDEVSYFYADSRLALPTSKNLVRCVGFSNCFILLSRKKCDIGSFWYN